MNKIELSSGYEIPQMGIGVYLVKDQEACKKSVLDSMENGCRHIDTAQMYQNEKAVGEAIRASGIPREEIYVTTKIWPTNYDYEKARVAIQASLDSMQLDYIDLMLLHQPYEDYLAAWKALEEAVDQGKIRSIGLSNFTAKQVQSILDIAKIKPVVNQVECHPYEQKKELRKFLKTNNIFTEAWYPLGHGNKKLLSDPVFAEIGKKYGKSNVQIILRWHIEIGNIIFPKSTNPAHIKSNMEIFDFELTKEDMDKIAGLDKRKPFLNPPKWLFKIVVKLMG